MSRVTDCLILAAPTIPKIARKKIYKVAVRDPDDSAVAGAVVPAAAGNCTVSVVDTAPATGSTVRGLKVQPPPLGKPEQAKPTACLNPFFGVTVMVKFPEDPGATLSAELLIDSE